MTSNGAKNDNEKTTLIVYGNFTYPNQWLADQLKEQPKATDNGSGVFTWVGRETVGWGTTFTLEKTIDADWYVELTCDDLAGDKGGTL